VSVGWGQQIDRDSARRAIVYALVVLGVLVTIWGLIDPASFGGALLDILFAKGTVSSALRLAVPIAMAALGGIYAEKSGVINIGLEGLLIVSAFVGVLVTHLLGAGESTFFLANVWWGALAGVVASTLLALLFAVVCIEFRADQIIAGLAVWLLALGLAPFAAKVVFGRPNTDSVGTVDAVTVPVLSALPGIGFLFDSTSPFVYAMVLAVPLTWWILRRTAFGRWLRASGENPQALDTVGVDVHRVRYAGVLLSGVFSGVGGVALSLGEVGQFTGTGQTMVGGRGFIAITAYLFGNYNPVGTFGASMLFAGLQAIQIRLQNVGIGIPEGLVRTVPFLTVIIVLALIGRTRLPAAAGEHYESGEE
jgi:simple sugar transport system permease protein